MEWLNNKLYDGYHIVGDISENVVRLCVLHPTGEKVVLEKYMSQVDLDNANLDDIRRHCARHINKIQSKTLDQLKLMCT